MLELTRPIIQQLFKPRNPQSHKGNYGHGYLVAGNTLRMGAAVIAGKACLRAGVGLLTLDVPFEERQVLHSALPEAMLTDRSLLTFSSEQYNALAMGPALGVDHEAQAVAQTYLARANFPVILDADTLTLLSQNPDWWPLIPPQSILTPHVKEFDRLFGEHTQKEERYSVAVQIAKERNVIIVLKDHYTFITNGGESFMLRASNPGLAKGGSGDALTGTILAFLAQSYAPMAAALLGVYLHSRAAAIALLHESVESVLITDVIDCYGKAFQQIQR
jgi:hydroxyethylthiazole kinase-like uncharacterized protein yjeF